MPKMKSHRGLAKRVKKTASGKLKTQPVLILLTGFQEKLLNKNVTYVKLHQYLVVITNVLELYQLNNIKED